jgi:hypothetical protein
MAKNSITDYDNIAANNTDIQSVDIDEGCAPSGINNAIRELMADLADVNDGTVPLASPDINGGTIDGVTIGGTTAGAGTFTAFTSNGIDDNASSTTVTLDSSGNVGIGTSSPNSYSGYNTLTLNGTSGSLLDFEVNGSLTGEVYTDGATVFGIQAIGSRALNFKTNNIERARIDSSGRLLIGHTTAKGSALDVDKANLSAASFNRTGTDGEIVAILKDGTTVGSIGTSSGLTIASSSQLRFFTSTSNEDMRLETDGDLHVDGNVIAYSTTISDKRLKKDIQPIENALWKVNQINGCTFTYLKDDRKSAGLIAQDLEKVLPSAVIEDQAVFHGEEGETYKTVQYDQVIGLLVEAIKELNAKVEGLENGITS